MNSLKSLLFPLSAILLIHLLFFTYAQIRPPVPLPDSAEYIDASHNLYKEGVLYSGDLSGPIREELFTRRPPIYPMLLGVEVATGSDLPVFIMQALFSLISIYLVLRMFGPGNWSVTKRSHLFLLFLFLLLLFSTPAQFIYSNRVMAEIPFQLTLVGMTWSLFSFFKSKESPSRHIWMFYLFLMLGMATKPVLFPFVIPVAVFSVFLFIRTKRVAWIPGLILPLLWITLFSIYNLNRTGSAQYSSIQTANLVNYNLRYFIMSKEGSEKAAEAVDQLYDRCGAEPGYPEKNRCLTQGVREVVRQRPFSYLLFHLKGSIRYFLDPGRFDLSTFFNINQAGSPGFLDTLNQDGWSGLIRFMRSQGWGWILLLAWIFLVKLFKFSGFLIYLIRGREDLIFRIFLGALAVYLGLVTGPLGASRFYLPVELLVIGAAMKGWGSLLYRPGPFSYRSSIL